MVRIVNRARTRAAAAHRSDEGFSLPELLVSIALLAILASVGLSIYHAANRGLPNFEQRADQHSDLLDATTLMNRDVDDAVNLREATASTFTVVVIRDGACNVITYTADAAAGTLTRKVVFYEQRACRGPSTERVQAVVKARLTSGAPFVYWGESPSVPIPTPVQDLRNVREVEWNLTAAPYENREAPDMVQQGGAVYTGLGESQGDGTPQLQALRPLLTVTTPVPGRDAPVLTWQDPSPEATVGWIIRRANQPEGTAPVSFQTIATINDKSTLTWTDTSLTAGERARYVVMAVLADGATGPGSNSVDTGLRPATPTGVTATGHPDSIAVSWNPASGATGYDVYRDGLLVHNVPLCPMDLAVCTAPPTTSWTDATGYGHSHTYQVVATNRWELALVTGAQDGRVPVGTPVGQAYAAGTVRLASQVTAASAAFTAPATPTLTATPTTTWTTVLGRQFAPWQGTGPVNKSGQTRDREWTVETATLAGQFGPLFTAVPGSTPTQTHTARTPGATDRYRMRSCNNVGCSPWTNAVSAMQRPPRPLACTVSGATTRSLSVTVNGVAMESAATGFEVVGGTGAPTGTGVQALPVFTVNQLTHGTTHTFTARVRNASTAGGGWSDAVTCSGSTAVLTAPAPTCTATVHDGVEPGSITISGGQQVKLGSGGAWLPGPQRYNGLSDGWFTGWALNAATDGYNSVTASDACPSQQITAFVPSPWSGTAPDCPGPAGWYVGPTSTWGWQVRRDTASTCALRTIVTMHGYQVTGVPEGTVLSTYRYTIGSGSSTWTQLSGEPRNAVVFWP